MQKCARVVEGSKSMHNYHISCTIDSLHSCSLHYNNPTIKPYVQPINAMCMPTRASTMP